MPHRRFWIAVGVCTCFVLLISDNASAAVSYGSPGSTYTQDFNGLPTDTRTNNNIESGATLPQVNYPTGWTDDTASPPAGAISLLGWYLYHPVSQGEGGANDHQRLRFGSGSNTGSFYGFANGDATNPEKSLGSSTSTTLAAAGDSAYMALRLTNNTGTTLNRFTLTYDGEQWRDGFGGPETLVFGYSTTATAADWFVPSSVTAVAGLNFIAPVTANDGGVSSSNVDGNVAGGGGGRVDNISQTVTGFNWAPNTDLWLRWADLSIAGDDDNLAIDDVSFTADAGGTGPAAINSIATGLASAASTWSNNQPASAGNKYNVVTPHVVTVAAPFPGDELRATTGGTVNFSASGVHFPLLAVDAGGNVTETTSGDFALGDINATTLATLVVNQDLNFSMDAGSDFFLDADVFGTGDLNFNSNGSGSDLELTSAGGHQGTIRFNGTGDEVKILRNESYNILEMNSTGANTLTLASIANVTNVGTVIFNQAGTIDHVAASNRLQGPAALTANAAVTVDLDQTFSGNERRLTVLDGLAGSGNITVNGTATDPTAGSVTLNEFEVGSTGEPGTVATDTYSGILTANDYVNVELRHNQPSARVVVNDNARLEMGHQRIPNARQMNLGEIVVNNGGTLEVGYEEDGMHNAYRLNLVNDTTRAGSLTIAGNDSRLVMQVNGTAANLFDSITADGNVMLDGTLEVIVNAVGSPGSDQMEGTAYAVYNPVVGDTFDLIKISASGPPPAGDYNGNGTVGPEDYTVWRAAFGTNSAAADGNLNGTVDAADYVLWRNNVGQTAGAGGTITGTFDNLVITNPVPGFNFQISYSATAVQLHVVAAAGGALAHVPEPASLVLAGLLLPALALRRSRS